MAIQQESETKTFAIGRIGLQTALLFIWSILPLWALAQLTVTGSVSDALTGESITGASVVVPGTASGTSTDRTGHYTIVVSEADSFLSFHALGYKPLIKQLHPARTQTLHVALEKDQLTLDEVTVEGKGRYRNRDNPAVALIQQVIAHKPVNQLSRYDYVSLQRYEKIMMAASNPPKGLLTGAITRGYRFALENIDSTLVPGTKLLPVYLEEQVARQYQRKSPATTKTLITAKKKTELDSRFVNNQNTESILNYIHGDIDIYENNILVLNRPFLSPTAESAPLFYKFYITDTLSNHDGTFVELTFVPRNEEDRLFSGKLQVTLDGNYGIRQADISINRRANLNWVDHITISLHFNPHQNGIFLPAYSDMRIHFKVPGSKYGLFGQRTLVYRNYNTSQQIPNEVFNGQQTVAVAGSNLVPDHFWEENRPIKLSAVESNTYSNFDSLRNNQAFKRTLDWSSLLFDGFKRAGPIEIGPIESIYSYNALEGNRVRISGRTSRALSEKIYGEAYTAYGFRDKQVKFYVGAAYTLNKRPVGSYPAHYLQVSYQQDAREPSQPLGFRNGDSFIHAFSRNKQDKWLYNNSLNINHVIEFGNHFRLQTHIATLKQTPAAQLRFISAATAADTIRMLQTTELGINLRWAPNEEFLQRNIARDVMVNKFPVFNLRYDMGVNGLLGSDYNYHALRFDIFKRVFLSQLGFADVNVGAGYIFGTLPFPLLDIPNTNQAYVLTAGAYHLMEELEFMSDQYIRLNIEHRLNGFLLNKIPLVKKLKLREIVSLRLLYGNVRPENGNTGVYRLPTDTNGAPTTFNLREKPYTEIGFGLENIFKIFRVEYIRRLTYLEHPGAEKSGIRIGASLSF